MAQTIASADLQISGAGLRVIDVVVSTAVDVPTTIQTEFAGKRNEASPAVDGLLVLGELTGPGIESPIRLETTPGHRFQIPGLPRDGSFFLQNIRLVNSARELLQAATPSIATITVANVLQTSVRVRQLSPEELRARGISIDARNQTAYEYTFTFLVNGQEVEVPYPVVVDHRTNELNPITEENPYLLPPINTLVPPRWSPPQTIAVDLAEEFPSPQEPEQLDAAAPRKRPSIPAAIVIPNNIAILHQFFAVALIVTNNSESGDVRLDSISALMKASPALRTNRSDPPVAFGQPLPIVDSVTGATFLIAQAQGRGEWVMEGLRPGTHRIEIEVRATLKSPSQADVPLRGTASAAILVHDPRFNITFSHPETVQRGVDYSTFAFISNLSPSSQTIRVGNGVPLCTASPGANVCRTDGADTAELTIPAGELRMIEYHLRSGISGHVFATAGEVEGDAITVGVNLHLGVSESGIPLSPATLVLPYYARYLDPAFTSSYLPLLGLSYSLATAPMTQSTAMMPRVIRADVFQRAVDIARAGQRIFIGEPAFDSLANLSLDLLGNSRELREWDELRRRDRAGMNAGSAVTRQLEATGLSNNASFADFVDRFGVATAHRDGYLLALVHSPALPPTLAVRGAASNRRLATLNESTTPATRDLPFGDLSSLRLPDGSRTGQIALVGRWSEDLDLLLAPQADGPFSVEVIYPAAGPGALLRARLDLTGKMGQTLRIPLARGDPALRVFDTIGKVADGSASSVSGAPLRVIAARQDLYLDSEGHRVSVLFNRPVGSAANLVDRFRAEISLERDGLSYRGVRPVSGAALQEERRIVHLSFDHALHQNANYEITVASVPDPLTSGDAALNQDVVPTVDHAVPAGIVYGRVLRGDHSILPGTEVTLTNGTDQHDVARESDGTFLFEAVPRDPANGISGSYRLFGLTSDGKHTSVLGAIRLPGRVHFVDLVFLGRGHAQGYVRYENGEKVANAWVVVGSTMFGQSRMARTNAQGFYRVEDLPVGPLTFSAADPQGNVGFASEEIKSAGSVLTRDITILRRPYPGLGTVRGIVLRSDNGEAVVGARVSVFTQGFAVAEATTNSDGRFEFPRVPAGFVSLLAADWTLARDSASIDFDLGVDEVRDAILTLPISPSESLVVIQGEVLREDPLHPNNSLFYQAAAGALVKIDGSQPVTADANGHYVVDSVPSTFAGRWIRAFDPVTRRTAAAVIPSLSSSGPNTVPILIRAQNGFGTGTVRVRLSSASGFPVSGYRVIEPGLPPTPLTEVGAGVYELTNVAVGREVTLWAVPRDSNNEFGQQTASGVTRVAFNGQISTLNLRLAGQGSVHVKLRGDIDLIGDIEISYLAWDEAEQSLTRKTRVASTAQNGQPGFAIFDRVPASSFTASSVHPLYGFASSDGRLAFEGDQAVITLQLAKLSTVGGFVYAIDGVTPVDGAGVRIDDGRQTQSSTTSGPDGGFLFRNVAAGVPITVIAEKNEGGIHRTGIASGVTPAVGGPLDDVALIMRRQGKVEARIVYSAYKVFDPADPSRNVPDDTPSLADNAPVPLAQFQVRELDFPRRSFGTLDAPRTADSAGRFVLSNLFEGPIRISAADPANQELRGEFTSAITVEGQTLTPVIGIGEGGVGSATIFVVDPNQGNAPVANADVTLFRGAPFDVGSTNSGGAIRFDNLPVGSYSAAAFSKAAGRSGNSASFTVTQDGNVEAQILLEFSGGIDGRVTDPELSGAPVAGAQVSLSSFSFQSRATTNALGNFSFEGVREGSFQIEARDAAGMRRAINSGSVSHDSARPFVALELEPTETLFLDVFLPNDSGADSGVLAPLVSLELRQGCRFVEGFRSCHIIRRAQGNSFRIADLLERGAYEIDLEEIGGEQRRLSLSRSFPLGSSTDPLRVVLPAFGSVEVHVSQAGSPSANAAISISGGGRDVRALTDSTGTATLRGVPLGDISAQVVSFDGRFSASAPSRLVSQSASLVLNVVLGSYATIAGFVDAEEAGPSSGTRVIAVADQRLETITDSEGRYEFTGIPTSAGGTRVDLTYIGPDDVTVGARRNVVVGNDAAGDVITVPPVRLDATPPRLLSVYPADGAQSVSPDIALKFTFTERLAPQFLSNAHFQLVPADSSLPVPASFSSSLLADGTFVVTLIPPSPPAAQQFALRSNTLYRLFVSGDITDLTGHRLPGSRGSTFITADYAEPRVVAVLPSPSLPIQAATSFEFRFNEQVDPAPWQAGGTGTARLFRIDQPAQAGQIIGEKSGRAFLDASNQSLFFAPDAAIEEASFFRIVFSGIRDLQGNVLQAQTFHFFSYDRVKPIASLISPVPATYPLVTGVEYFLNIDLKNPDGTAAVDIEHVDYVRVTTETESFLFSATKAPYAYRFVAPDASQSPTLTLRARARDLSGNVSDPATMTFDVVPNLAPANVAVSLNAPGSVYPGSRVGAAVTFQDEGVLASIQVAVQATKSDGSSFNVTQSRQVTRTTVATAWPDAMFTFDLPPDLRADTQVTFDAAVSDVRGQQGRGSTTLALLKDTGPPQVTIAAPSAGTLFSEGSGNLIAIGATAVDSEVAVKQVTAQIEGGAVILLTRGANHEFTGNLPVPNVDDLDIVTRSITVTARDYEGNAGTGTVDVRIEPLYDANAPVVSWTCSSRGVMGLAGSPIRLRVLALGNDAGNPANGVQSVNFFAGSSTTAIPATAVSGVPNQWETTFLVPADASPESRITLRAVVTNVAGTTSEATSSLLVVTGRLFTADATVSDDSLAGQTIIVQAGTLTFSVPQNLDRLIILDGAKVTQSPTAADAIRRLEIAANAIYVSCGGSIDVSSRGFTGYSSGRGATWPNSTAAGSAGGAGGSHGGSGGTWDATLGASAKPYGSLFDPNTPGSAGGYTRAENCANCGAGGGTARLTATAFTLDGAIRSNGTNGTYDGWYNLGIGGGAGGSIRIDATTLSGGGEIHADGGGEGTAAGGGGRIAIYAPTLTLDRSRLTAAGGNNVSDARRGSAGTIFLKTGTDVSGELIVDNAGRNSVHPTTLTSVRMRTVAAAGADFVQADNAQFLAPDHLRGIHLVINGNRSTVWPISSNTADQVNVDISAAALLAEAGQPFRGLYRFDRLRLRHARLEVEDLVELGSAVDKDSASTAVFGNEAPPVLNPGLISITSSALGSAVVGAVGAVQDNDKPIAVFATNARTNLTASAMAAANGSFIVPVQGQMNDRITLRARDGHRFPLETATIDVGVIPVDAPSPVSIDKSGWNVDAPFRARTVAAEGNHLVVASRNWDGVGASNRLVIFDISNPAAPAYRETPTMPGAVRDVVIRNGWAYVAADDLRVINLNAAPLVAVLPDSASAFGESAIAVDGTYAILAEESSNGGLHIYEITDPARPRKVLERQLITPIAVELSDLQILGRDYLVGISPKKTSSNTVGHDVMVVDRRDLNNLRTVVDLDIPNFDGFRGMVSGTTLYIAGQDGALAIVDVTNPRAPVVRSVTAVGAPARGVDVVGTDALVAATAAALQNYGVTEATAPLMLGALVVGGNVWDVQAHGPRAYVANENGLVVVAANLGPQIELALIQGTRESPAFRVAGAARAIQGQGLLNVELRNESAANSTTFAAESDGSFNGTIPASAGDRITVMATDSSSRTAGPVSVGVVPFGTSTTLVPITATISGDPNFRARTLAGEGNHLVVASRQWQDNPSSQSGASSQLLVYDVSTAGSPVFRQSIRVSNSGVIRDVAVRNGVAFVAADDLRTVNLTTLVQSVPDFPTSFGESAIAVDGTYAFLAEESSNGGLHVYDITDPARPVKRVERQAITAFGAELTSLQLLGTDYLIGSTWKKTSTTIGHDVVVIDRRDINNLKTVADIDIPNFDALRGKIEGNLLYLSGFDAGVAIVDLSNPAAPVVRSVTNTPGIVRGLDVAGSAIAAADGNVAVTMLDATDPASVVTRGTQQTGGNNWDACFGGSTLYVATEHGIAVIDGFDAGAVSP